MSKSIRVRVVPDYDSFATYVRNAEGHQENVPPSELGISPVLSRQLDRWAEFFGNTLDQNDPASSGFRTDLEAQLFSDLGAVLAVNLARELDEEIEYFELSSGTNRVIRPDGEFIA